MMNAISISNVAIRQNDNRFFNLNDLHQASGGSKVHQPANWLRNQQTQELIAEIEAEGGKAFQYVF
ncbi:KilA-N domain-containing protein [Neisseria lactamica]|uniref:KilA-N domain-containing protein n=1 Tax=Neisseria lactamica TaxID=486 RepID=UPI000E5765E2|nr:KilA-N domain-containing protein [Neisseria lactamica]